ncbi:MAG: hypothetical protein GX786_03495 [Clostridiales bacterium]|nr:hypothetical protein [Clostridiales bacterium]
MAFSPQCNAIMSRQNISIYNKAGAALSIDVKEMEVEMKILLKGLTILDEANKVSIVSIE